MPQDLTTMPKLLAVQSSDGVSYFGISLDDCYTPQLKHKDPPDKGYDHTVIKSPFGNSFQDCLNYVTSIGYCYDNNASLTLGQTVLRLELSELALNLDRADYDFELA